MKIIVDNKIPYISETLEKIADQVIYLPGKDINHDVVEDADAIITRTRTKCNKELLEGSAVKYIGTATIGFDHIDTKFCKEANITWKNCPGCNAGAVEQYVHAVLILLEKERGLTLKNSCIGIVGVGHVGNKIYNLAKKLGIKVLLNDPPRNDNGENGFVDLKSIAENCDIITFHTPLIREGRYKTYHLANKDFFRLLKRKPVIINTSRGEVIETQAILDALNTGTISEAVIDVWENEPHINTDLLDKVFIGTPHIAGYSVNGKINATKMTLESLCEFFNINTEINITPPHDPNEPYSDDENTRILQKYNPHTDCEILRAHTELFEQLRGDYTLRRE